MREESVPKAIHFKALWLKVWSVDQEWQHLGGKIQHPSPQARRTDLGPNPEQSPGDSTWVKV